MSAKQYKLDIFQVLNHISQKHADYFEKLTEEEQKALQPLVVMRWLTGTSDARQIYFLNELVNRFVFSLSKHKQLLYDLMTICTIGKPQRYRWNKSLSKKSTTMPTAISVVKDFLHYSTSDAVGIISLLSNEDILEYADHLGKQKEDVAKLKKELKTRDERLQV